VTGVFEGSEALRGLVETPHGGQSQADFRDRYSSPPGEFQDDARLDMCCCHL
jgi:hypothetical protein